LAEEIKKTRRRDPDEKSSSLLAGRQLREHLPVIHHGMSTTPIKADLFQPLQPVMPRNVEQKRERKTNARSSFTASRKRFACLPKSSPADVLVKRNSFQLTTLMVFTQ
jgi:hypothetical protein